jgi:hypothetical protein
MASYIIKVGDKEINSNDLSADNIEKRILAIFKFDFGIKKIT